MTTRPTLEQIEAAARVLHKDGLFYRWFKGKSYDQIAATDPIGKSEFDGTVERMLMAAFEKGPISKSKGITEV
jgi:hypothetical protein